MRSRRCSPSALLPCFLSFHGVSSAGEALQAPSPPAEPAPTPSKRLFIRADFKWKSEADRTLVLMELCEAMAQNRLERPFWIKNFLIHPTGQSVEGSGAERCVQYHVKISRSALKPRKSTAPRRQVGAVAASVMVHFH